MMQPQQAPPRGTSLVSGAQAYGSVGPSASNQQPMHHFQQGGKEQIIQQQFTQGYGSGMPGAYGGTQIVQQSWSSGGPPSHMGGPPSHMGGPPSHLGAPSHQGYAASAGGFSAHGQVGQAAAYAGSRQVQEYSQVQHFAGQDLSNVEVVERTIEVPQIQYVERVIEVPQVQVQEKLVYVDKVEYQERIVEVPRLEYIERVVEVPQVQYVEKVVEVPQIISQEKLVHLPKIEYQERIVEVVRPVVEERIVEVPQIEYREVLVERIVEVPQVQIETIERQVVVPQIVHVPQTVVRQVEVDKVVPQVMEKVIPRPVPVERTIEVQVEVPNIQYKKVQVTEEVEVVVPRYEQSQPVYQEVEVVKYVPQYVDKIVPTPRHIPMTKSITKDGLESLVRSIGGAAAGFERSLHSQGHQQGYSQSGAVSGFQQSTTSYQQSGFAQPASRQVQSYPPVGGQVQVQAGYSQGRTTSHGGFSQLSPPGPAQSYGYTTSSAFPPQSYAGSHFPAYGGAY